MFSNEINTNQFDSNNFIYPQNSQCDFSSENPETDFAKIKILGQGGLGTVAQVVHTPTKTVFAGKLIDKKILEISESANNLQAEVDYLKQISHPNLSNYYGSIPLEDSFMLLSDYCHYGSLRQILDIRQQVLSEDQISILIKDVLTSLLFLHNNVQIIHRDIKASNILLTKNGEVKVSDFDIYKLFDSQTSQAMTIVNTPYWIAPEVLSALPYTFSSDIWSVGITTVELCEGAPPYAELSGSKAIIEIAVRGFPGYRFPSMHSPELCNFISHCLESDPKERWTIEQLLEHPFIKRAERLNRQETLNDLINLASFNSENGGSSSFSSPLSPTQNDFLKCEFDGGSFEGMVDFLSHKFDDANSDLINSNSFCGKNLNVQSNSINEFNIPFGEIGGFSSFTDFDSFKDQISPLQQGNPNHQPPSFNSFKTTNSGFDSFNGMNIPFAQGDNQGFDSFQNAESPSFSSFRGFDSFIQINDTKSNEMKEAISNDASDSFKRMEIPPMEDSSKVDSTKPNSNPSSPKPHRVSFNIGSSTISSSAGSSPNRKTRVQYNFSPPQRTEHIQPVSDELFVGASRALSAKIPFVPFQIKKKKPKKKEENVTALSMMDKMTEDEQRISEIREQLKKPTLVYAMTIFLLFIFIFGVKPSFYLCGLLLVVSMFLLHLENEKEERQNTTDRPIHQ